MTYTYITRNSFAGHAAIVYTYGGGGRVCTILVAGNIGDMPEGG